MEEKSDKTDFSNLISELTKIKDEGNSLYKEKKIEEAKNKFKEGNDKFEKEKHQEKKKYIYIY